MLLAIAERLR